MRWRRSVASLGSIAMVAALLSVFAPAAASAAPVQADAASPSADNPSAEKPSRWVFNYAGETTQTFTVPDGVTALTMLVTGGAGANPNEAVAPGGMSGFTLTRQPVTPGETLGIWVGQGGTGGGGWGWGCGGDHGHAPDSFGRDGAGGGGASAVTVGAVTKGTDCSSPRDSSSVLAVGGGGAGGGGDGWFINYALSVSGAFGGAGGDGGNPAATGGEPEVPTSQLPAGKPGCGGCSDTPNGTAGGNADYTVLGGGGGGGGGGFRGGEGGGGSATILGGAGAGGGGGLSYAKAGGVDTFFQTGDAVGDGQVVLSLEPELGFGGCTGAPISVAAPHGFPLVHVHAEGAEGGTARNAQGGRGGYGGTIDGDARIASAHPDLSLTIGCSGANAGYGYEEGGSHGSTDGHGYTGGTGAGATGVSNDGALLAIAGGGGGGGGDGGDGDGGAGGDGGNPAGAGAEGKTAVDDGEPASGGAGGCQTLGHGGPGGDIDDDPFSHGGGGGGGGGGLRGGCGGAAGGGYNPGTSGEVGGGGGGAGSSAVGHGVRNAQFGTTKRGGDGLVLLSLGTMAISSDGGSKQRAEINTDFADQLTARVSDASGDPIEGVTVEFDLRGDGPGQPSGVFGLWDAGIQTKRVTTDANGIAHSGVVTAGINPGAWTATASLTDYDVDDVAHFQLKNVGVPSTTVASVDPKPALYLAPITFSAAVSGGFHSPHGTVDFWIDGTKQYTGALQYTTDDAGNSVATATYTPNRDPGGLVLEPGDHTLYAVYGGDEAYGPSSSTTSFRVVDEQSVTTVTSSQNPVNQGTDVVFTVATGVPDGAKPLAGYNVTLTLASGAGQRVIHGILDAHGEYRTDPTEVTQNTEVTARVSGDGPVAGSTGGMFQYVVGDGNLVAVAATSSPNPAAPGQPVDFTAQLTPPDGGQAPTGTVIFTNGSAQLCQATVVNSAATCTGANPLNVGQHRIVATYSGDTNYGESYGVVYQETIPGVTTTTVAPEPTSDPVFGQPTAFTAHVALATGDTGTGEIIGTVAFTVDGQPIGDPAPVGADGTATSTAIDSLAVGQHHIVATYSGSTNLLASSGSTDTVVWAADTSVALAASAEPSVTGSPVSFTATVSAQAPGAGVPAGTVQFTVDGDDLGDPVTLAAGVAVSPSTDSLTTGDHTVKAVFTSSDANFMPSTASITHVVDTATHMQLGSSANPSRYGEAVTLTATVTPSAGTASIDHGTVEFTIDGTTASGCDAVHVSDGVATCDAHQLAAGPHTIAASYSGTHEFAAASATLIQVVGKATTGTVVTSSVNPSTPNEEVFFTATLNTDVGQSAGQQLTGTVQFAVDGAEIGDAVALVNGKATSVGVTSFDLDGSHQVIATYSGDADFAGSSGELIQWVGADRTATTVSSSKSPSVFGQAVRFTAKVTAQALTPAGSIQFQVDGVPFGDLVPVVDGSATSKKITTLAAGQHRIVAEFLPDAPFTSSSGAFTQTVGTAASSATLDSSANPSAFGSPVTFTASVSGDGPTPPTGDVQFAVDGQPVGLPVALVGAETVSPPVSGLSVGPHDVTASYLGDGNYSGSSSQLLQHVTPAGTTTSVVSSANPAQVGTSVQFTATVDAAGAGIPTGDVQFRVDGVALGTPVSLVNGVAISVGDAALTADTHTVTAEYLGDGTFTSSTSKLTQHVFEKASTTSVVSSSTRSVYGQSVTFTATVAGDGTSVPKSGVPTGKVQFTIDGTPFGSPVTVHDGRAESGAVDDLTVKDHTVVATYAGTIEFGPSAGDLTQSVGQANTTTSVTSSTNPSAAGDVVTFTATVGALAPGAGSPTGVVQFSVDGQPVGLPLAVTDGRAVSPAVTGLALGDHEVVADYLGDDNFAGSSDTMTQTVATGTTTTLASSQNPSAVGDSVTFTATVAAAPNSAVPSSGATTFAAGTAPTGTVQFSVDGTAHGSPVDTVDGVASMSVADLTAGEHTITATFTGDGYAASTGTVKQQVDGATPPTPPPGPPGPPAPPHGNGTLPNTGSDVLPFAGLALLLLALGAAASVVTVRLRRRRRL